MTVEEKHNEPHDSTDDNVDEFLNEAVNTTGKGIMGLGGICSTGTTYGVIKYAMDGGFVSFCNSLGRFPWVYKIFQIQNTYTPWLCSWFPQAACIGFSGFTAAANAYILYKFYKYLKKHNFNVTDIVEENSDFFKDLFFQFMKNQLKLDLEAAFEKNKKNKTRRTSTSA